MRIITTEQPLEDVGRYLRHWANPAYVDEILQGQHLGLTAEKRRKKASDLAATINQALELLHLARSASPLTQPLPLFYAAEAIAKALVIFHQAPVDGSKIGRHPQGVWRQFAPVANGDWLVLRGRVNGTEQMSNWRQTIDAPLPPQNSELELRNLLRHLPELAEDVELAGWGCSYAVRSPFLRINFTTDDPPRVSLSTNLRHDHDPAIKALIQRAFAHRLHEYTLGPDTLDVYHASVAERDGWPTLPIMRADIFGEPYWDLAPRRVRL